MGMTLQQRHNIKQEWFKGVETIREISMPNEAKFFVGQEVIHDDRVYEIVGYYDYFGKFPTYLAWCWSNGSPSGIPLTIQDEMYLKSEAHLHPHAKIIRMNYRH